MGIVVDRIASGEERGIRTRWLNFYVYVRIPFGILISTIHGIPGIFLAYPLDSAVAMFTLALTALDLCLAIFLFIGLHRRRLWGWRLNWFALVFEVLTRPLDRSDDVIVYFTVLIGLTLVWLLPNAIYFKKRRHLFS